MSISFTNNKSGQSTRTVTTTSPSTRHTSAILEDTAIVKWIKAEIAKARNGMWATRLALLYEEKFKKKMTDADFLVLKSRPDIVRMEEIIEGRMLLYSSVQQHLQTHQDKLPTAKKATSPKETLMPHQTESFDVVLPCGLPDVASICMVHTTHVENVGCFYVSKNDCISETLSMDILKEYESTKYNADDIPSIAPDQIFCAQFTGDNFYYRARILEIVDSRNIHVLYVDFGNQEVIGVERLRILKKEFHSQPVQAFQCCLDGVQPANEDQDWSEAALKKFNELTSDEELKMTVKDREGKILSVCLYDELSKTDIGEELVKAAVASPIKNLASTLSSSSSSLSSSSSMPSETKNVPTLRRVKLKSPGIVEIPQESYVDVLVCNITGTYNVYLRLIGDEYSNRVEAIQETMTSYYSHSKDEVVTEPVAGDLFALLCEEVWCRVEVLSVNGPTIKVFFVDHGDTAETTKSELRILAPQFQQLPLQVFQCALNGLPNTKNPDLVDKLQRLCMGEVCVAGVVKRSPELIFVDLFDTRNEAVLVVNDVIRKLVIQDEELKPVLPKPGETVEVYVPYISPSGSVYLNVLGAGIKRLEELNKDLTEHYLQKRAKASEFVSNPTVDKVYCAKCDKDSNWYRAKIISAANKKAVEVLYVDYGNTDTVPSSNLREPTRAIDHVLSLPFQALECQLYDIPKADWNEDFAKDVLDTLSQGVVTAEVISEGDLPSVSLLVTIGGSDDEDGLTERLTRFLGIQDDEDNSKDALESGQDGDKTVRVNGGIDDCNDESDINAENKETNVDKKDGKNVANEDRGNVADEINVAVDETNVAVDDKNVRNDNGRTVAKEEVNHVLGNKIAVGYPDLPVDSAQGTQKIGNDTADVEGAVASELVVEPIPGNELSLVSGEWIDVVVTEVKDPERFTFQLLVNVDELCTLGDKMNDYYQQNVAVEETLVEGGVYAACSKHDRCWYRAIVEEIMKDDKVYVYFVDYGDTSVVEERENIQPLQEDFLQLPFQGVQGSLVGVQSRQPRWSKDCVQSFKRYTLNQQLVAKVTNDHTSYHHMKQKSPVLLELYDTSDPKKDVSIAVKLIEEKYANAKLTG